MITIFAGGGEKEQRKESRRPIHTTQHQTSYGVQSTWPRKCGRWKLDHGCRGKFMRWYEWLYSDVRLRNQYWCNKFWPSGSRCYGLHHKPLRFTVVHVSYKFKINMHMYFILFKYMYHASSIILYNDQQMHNYLTNYHTSPTYFDTIVSSLRSS
jgi:hypothetical protein